MALHRMSCFKNRIFSLYFLYIQIKALQGEEKFYALAKEEASANEEAPGNKEDSFFLCPLRRAC